MINSYTVSEASNVFVAAEKFTNHTLSYIFQKKYYSPIQNISQSVSVLSVEKNGIMWNFYFVYVAPSIIPI